MALSSTTHRSTSRARAARRLATLASLIGLISLPAVARAQAQRRGTAATAELKAVWEPVSYSADIALRDVFFVTVDVGWVAGDKGTILRTTNGGRTWEAQLGGDPESQDETISLLRFVDERHGWAKQGNKLLQTRGGESWEEIGTLPYAVADLVFTSPQTGFVAAKAVETSQNPSVIYRTVDGGRTWRPVWSCAAGVQMGGVSRQVKCYISQFHFPTPRVGYAVAHNDCVGMGCEPPPLIAKTEDGGETWRAMLGPGVAESDGMTSLFFVDERTGFARLHSGKLHMTTDGGATWKGIVASPGRTLRFADPSVGWAIDLVFYVATLSYTTNGGTRWTSRAYRFPASTNAFSFPRRDRAYVVGDHGMVFRYRVVPASHRLGPNDIPAAAMPGFGSALDEQIAQLERVVGELEAALPSAPAGTTAAAGSMSPASNRGAGEAATSGGAAEDPLDAPLPPPSAYTAQCCKQPFSRLEAVLGALAQTLPDFIGQYRNLNLLLAGIRMSAELPQQHRAVRSGLRAFRRAENREAAQAALAEVRAALQAIKQTTAVAMQQELPPGGSP